LKKKSRNSHGGDESCGGESDEYDDTSGSDSDGQNRATTTAIDTDFMKSNHRIVGTMGRFRNDETLLVSDRESRKSLPRSQQHRQQQK